MKKLIFLILGIMLVFLISCGDDNGNNSTSAYEVEMSITGDQTLDFKTNLATIVVPPANPNFMMSSFMNVDGTTHAFSVTIDDGWLDKKEIDLTRDKNQATFAYDQGRNGNTYRVISGTFKAEILTEKTVKGTISFTAAKLGEVGTTIQVENGKIHINK